jgi:hypothetical protein
LVHFSSLDMETAQFSPIVRRRLLEQRGPVLPVKAPGADRLGQAAIIARQHTLQRAAGGRFGALRQQRTQAFGLRTQRRVARRDFPLRDRHGVGDHQGGVAGCRRQRRQDLGNEHVAGRFQQVPRIGPVVHGFSVINPTLATEDTEFTERSPFVLSVAQRSRNMNARGLARAFALRLQAFALRSGRTALPTQSCLCVSVSLWLAFASDAVTIMQRPSD